VVLGWLFTLPAAAIVGAISAWLVGTGPAGIVIDGIVTVGVILAIFQIARRNAVTHKHVASEIEEASEVVLTKKQRNADAKQAKASTKSAAKSGAKKSGNGKGKK
jgi:PiT family inorganic phosphate transporter